MTARAPVVVAALAASASLLAGCGYKGPLTLPEKGGPVIIRPAPKKPAEKKPEDGSATEPQPAKPISAPETVPAPTSETTPKPATAPTPEGSQTGG
jgi:predicted small lipoprotein YifL